MQAASSYSYRPGLSKQLATYTLTPSGLLTPAGPIPLSSIRSLRIYTLPGTRSLTGILTRSQALCLIHVRDHRPIRLSSLSFVSLGRFDDRTADFEAFTSALAAALRAADATVPVLRGMPPGLWWSWTLVFGALVLACAFVICVLLVMMFTQGFRWQLLAGLSAFALMAYGPYTLLRATWRRRSRPAERV